MTNNNIEENQAAAAVISVKTTFTFVDDAATDDGSSTTQLFDASNTPIVDKTVVAASSEHPYSYTGRHDAGPLPPPRNPQGSYAQLVSCVQATKEFSNQYLTNVIKQEKCRRPGNGGENDVKKQKV